MNTMIPTSHYYDCLSMMLVILVVADIALLECNYSTFLFYLLVLLALMIQSNFC